MSFNIMNPSMGCKHDNVTDMLSMLIGTPLDDYFKSMIKWSNVCPKVLKFIRQKERESVNLYLLMLNVLEVFDFVYVMMLLEVS
jgi:hypothetical protein